MSATILSIEDRYDLVSLNGYLKTITGVDFLKGLAELGFNEKKTEIDAKKFIEENYPISGLLAPKDTAKNKILLLSFYFTVEKVYYSTERATTCCSCEAKKSDWDDNFRAPSMNLFLRHKPAQEKSMYLGFLPLS